MFRELVLVVHNVTYQIFLKMPIVNKYLWSLIAINVFLQLLVFYNSLRLWYKYIFLKVFISFWAINLLYMCLFILDITKRLNKPHASILKKILRRKHSLLDKNFKIIINKLCCSSVLSECDNLVQILYLSGARQPPFQRVPILKISTC